MTDPASPSAPAGRVAEALARAAGALLACFWGAFFVEHLAEWFLRGDGRLPPASVWVAQGLHGAMVAALAWTAFRPRWGSLAALAATAAYFAWIGYPGIPYLALPNALPAALAWRGGRERPR